MKSSAVVLALVSLGTSSTTCTPGFTCTWSISAT